MAEEERDPKQELSETQDGTTDRQATVGAAPAPAVSDASHTDTAEAGNGSDPAESPQSNPRISSPEILDSELESVRPLPPSLRLKTAQDATSRPMKVHTTLPPVRWPPKVVADVMTRKLITVEEHEPIGELEEWMQRFKFHHLPVVDKAMKLSGMISLTDYLHAELGKKPDGSEAPKFAANMAAGAIMRKNVVFARIDSHLSTACRVMLEKGLTCMPVVTDDGTLVGILTKSDFVRLAKSLLEAIQYPTTDEKA